jgi:hypothetical protein
MVSTRQAGVAPPSPTTTKTEAVKKAPQSAAAGAVVTKSAVTAVPRRIQKYPNKGNLTKFRKTKATNDESVQVIKMLTGTLYLYRGMNPRAEFLRKV